MRKLFTFLFAALMSVSMFAATVTWDSNTLSSINIYDGESFTQDGVTVTSLIGMIDGMQGQWMGNSNDASFKFSTSLGNFTRIEITGDIRVLGGSGWTQTSPGAVWTGDANETTFGEYFPNVSQIVFTIAEPAPADPNREYLSLDPSVWSWGYNSVSGTVEGGLQTTIISDYGAVSMGWDPERDLSEWDKIVIEVSHMEDCAGEWWKLKAYLRDEADSEGKQMEGFIGLNAVDNELNYLVIDLHQQVEGFDLTKARVLAVQCEPTGGIFTISSAYLLKEDAPAAEAEYAEIVWTEPVAKADLAADATFTAEGSLFSATIADDGDKMEIDANTCRFGTAEDYKSYTHRLKSGGASSSTKNFITLNIPEAGKLRIAPRTGANADTTRTLVIEQAGAEIYREVVRESQAIEVTEGDQQVKVYPYVEVAVAAGSVRVSYTSGMNFYSFGFAAESEPTAVENTAVETKAIKRIVNGQLLIEKNGKLYNMTGAEVK